MQRINFIDQPAGHPSGKPARHHANCRIGKLASVQASRQLDQHFGDRGGVLAGVVSSVFVGKPATRSDCSGPRPAGLPAIGAGVRHIGRRCGSEVG